MDSWLSLSLLIFGVITASMLVIVLAPKSGLMWFFQREVSEPYSLFLAQAGALPISAIGALMIWASFIPAMQCPVAVVAIISKLVFIGLLFKSWAVVGKGYLLTIYVDALAVIVLFSLLVSA